MEKIVIKQPSSAMELMILLILEPEGDTKLMTCRLRKTIENSRLVN
jgi:hypothetical protein